MRIVFVERNIHAEGFVSFLETARREIFQRVDVLAEDEAATLADAEREGRYKFLTLNVGECRFAPHAVDE